MPAGPTHRRAAPGRGFTLIELLVVIAIAGILLALALPSFRTIMLNTRARGARDSLFTSINLARTKAMAGSGHIVLCPSTDHTTCSGSTAWHTGWIVFQDSNSNNQHDDGEQILEQTAAQRPGQAILSTSGRTHVTYRQDGTAGGSNVTISFCDGRGSTQASAIIVNNVGRPRIGKPTVAQAQAACAGI